MRLKGTRGFAKKRRGDRLGRGQKGFVLVELLISIAIFGVISVGFLSALVAGYHGVIVAHDVTTAESLTRTHFEEVAHAEFPVVGWQDTHSRYDVTVSVDNITDLDTYTVVNAPSDFQKVTVTVSHHDSGETILNSWMTKVR